jgi:Peptidase family M1 domain
MRHLFAAFALSCLAYAQNADPVYHTLRTAEIAESFTVGNLVIKRDAGVLTLKSGTLGLTAPTGGRDIVAVFSGEGEFTLDPPLGIEKFYLKQVIEQESIRESFDRAVFLFTDETGRELRGQLKSHPADPPLSALLKDFRKRVRDSDYDSTNLDAEVLRDLYNPKQAGFFSAYLHGRKHSDLQFYFKPRGVAADLPSPEEVGVINRDPSGGDGGIWYLSHRTAELAAGKASSAEENRVVEVENYQIGIAIASNDRFTASAKIALYTVNDGDRVIPFDLLPTLRVSKVTSNGQDVPFVQEDRKQDGALYVILPQSLAKDAKLELAIEYAGDKVVHKSGGGNFSVGARTSWYPSVNAFRDHARYRLTFKVPKRYTLVSIGRMVKEWREKDVACSEWDSEVPVAVAGFNFGEFKKKVAEDSTLNMTLEGYAVSEMPDSISGLDMGGMSPSRLNEANLIDSQNAVRLYTLWFGKSEFSKLSITQQPEFSFGQSWPSLVYLPLAAYLDATQRHQLFGMNHSLTMFVDEVASHEVSHQWWGHMVGWSTYRVQWLSEGFAFFSAGLYLQYMEKNPQKYLDYWENARKQLVAKNEYGKRPVEAGGPWMGLRLGSRKNDNAYQTVVYNKGGYVLNMLRMMMWNPKDGDKAFREMLQEFVKVHLNRNATTESFQAVAEKYMTPGMDVAGNHKLDWFFAQWVYGTTVPRLKFEPEVTSAADGKWLLKGTLTQSEVDANFTSLVPLHAEFDTGLVRLGVVRLLGNTTVDKIQLMLPKKPKRVLINAYHDVLEL